MLKLRSWALLLSIALGGSAAAASIEDLAWMAGDWRNGDGQNLTQEVWTEPMAGSMTGMFRLIQNAAVRVYEYVVITEEFDGIYYQFKHFRPDYSTWEGAGPHLRFELIDSEPGRAVFKNTGEIEGQPAYISYLRGDDGRVTVLVGAAPTAGNGYEGFRFVLTREGD